MTAKKRGLTVPAEWAPHESTLVAWPAAADLWLENLAPAQEGFVQLCRAIALGERVNVLVTDETAALDAKRALAGLDARFLEVPYGDIWLRDIAPIFFNKEVCAVFRFNGWGGKYVLPHDDRVASRLAESLGCDAMHASFVLEGGSIEVDGEGCVLTTEQCLLNPNRGNTSKAEVEERLCEWLGVSRVLWLEEGLLNDHTDGHIDTLARFVRPGVVACMQPAHDSDPNAKVLDAIARDLSRLHLEVVRIPSPGLVLDDEEEIMPASYANYYLANRAVIVPQYGVENDALAVQAIGALFPDRRAVGAPAKAILSGGGAFHCITQQVPR